MATAILRIKRRRDDEPADCLILSSKRSRQDNLSLSEGADTLSENSLSVQSVFKFAGTIAGGDTAVAQYVTKAIRKEKLQNEFKRHEFNTRNDCAMKRKRQVINSRYTITSQRRALDLAGLNDPTTDHSADQCVTSVDPNIDPVKTGKFFSLFDVEKQDMKPCTSETQKIECEKRETISCNGVAMVREKVSPQSHLTRSMESGYVYDIYYMNDAQFDFRNLENILAVEAFREEFVYGGDDSDDELDDDEDDENAESNWRNDYPDEDPGYIEAMNHPSTSLYRDDDLQYGMYSEDEDFDDVEANFRRKLQVNEDDDENDTATQSTQQKDCCVKTKDATLTPKSISDYYREIRTD